MDLPHTRELNCRVKLRKQKDMPTMGGTSQQDFTDMADVWAKHVPAGTAVFFGTKQTAEEMTDRFIVRRNSQINETTISSNHVIEFDSQRYRVKRASDLKGQRRFVMIDTENLGNV